MADQEHIIQRFDGGQLDGVDAQDTPRNAATSLLGFECRRSYARTVTGRQALTSSQLRTTKRVRKLGEWFRSDDTTLRYAVIDGGVWAINSTFTAIDTTYDSHGDGLISKLAVGASSASRASNVVTISGARMLYTVRAGDYFYFDTDGPSAGGVVSSVDSETQITLTSYAGAGTSGAFVIWRKIADGRTWCVVCGDRLWIADGTGPLHWFGDDASGTSTDVFREAGLRQPATRPSVTLGSGGALSAGNYIWYIAFKDSYGNVGPVIGTYEATATANQKCTLGSLPTPPGWASEYVVYRNIAGNTEAFNITGGKITTKLGSIGSYIGGSDHTVLTLAAGTQVLVADKHIHRKITFATSGNSYTIKDNDGATPSTITVHGNAASETATDYVTISGDFMLYRADAGTTAAAYGNSIVDMTSDALLDFLNEAPGTLSNTTRSYNEPPPSGLSYLTKFKGDGRLCALGTGQRIWFSGRPPIAPKTGQPEFYGDLEFDYWPHYHNAGPDDGDLIKGIIELGDKTFVIRSKSVYELDQDSDDVSLWGWMPVTGAEGKGLVSPDAIITNEGVAWWLGRDSGEVDIIRFDGSYAMAFGRPKLRAVLDGINSTYFDECVACMFNGRLYVSFPNGAGTTNDRTLRYDMKTKTWDTQPWGIGVTLARTVGTLLCGAPTTVGHIYQVHGTAKDLGSDISREIITGDLLAGDVADEVTPVDLVIEVVVE